MGLEAIERAEAEAGTVQFPEFYAFRAAQNAYRDFARAGAGYHRGRDQTFFDDERRLQRALSPAPHRRVRGVWRSARLAGRRAGTVPSDPAQTYQLKEAMEMLSDLELELFRLHVLEGLSLKDCAKRMRLRKVVVSHAWHEMQEYLRTTLPAR